jgi:hypothetical protein
MNDQNTLSLSDIINLVLINRKIFLIFSILILVLSFLFIQFNDKGYRTSVNFSITDEYANTEINILTLLNDGYLNNYISNKNLFNEFISKINNQILYNLIRNDQNLWLDNSDSLFDSSNYEENELLLKFVDQYNISKTDIEEYTLYHFSKSPNVSKKHLNIIIEKLNNIINDDLKNIISMRKLFLEKKNDSQIANLKFKLNQIENQYTISKNNYINQLKDHLEIAERLGIANETDLGEILKEDYDHSELLKITNFFELSNENFVEKDLFGQILNKYKQGTILINEEINLLQNNDKNILNYQNYSSLQSDLEILEARLDEINYSKINNYFLKSNFTVKSVKKSAFKSENLSYNQAIVYISTLIALWVFLISFFSIKLIISRNNL